MNIKDSDLKELSKNLSTHLNLPLSDIIRSSMAYKVCHEAYKNQLFCYNYEHRWQIPIGEQENEDLWDGGVLKESKYQSFRIDQVIGAFHAGQSSKWGSHELCHKLQGFYWKPNMTFKDVMLSAWMGEILPVCLFYFWDEIKTKRCEIHTDAIASSSYCHNCEEIAQSGEENKNDSKLFELGLDFFEKQIENIKKIQATEIISYSPFLNLNLGVDAYQYAKEEIERMQSPEQKEWVHSFFLDSKTAHYSFDSYLERIYEVKDFLCHDKPLSSLDETKESLIQKDISSRIYDLMKISDEDLKVELKNNLDLIKDSKWDELSLYYKDLEKTYNMPSYNEFFSVGYDIPSIKAKKNSQMQLGVQSILLDKKVLSSNEIDSFIAQDKLDRSYLGKRISKYFKNQMIDMAIDLVQPAQFYYKDYKLQTQEIRFHRNLRFYEVSIKEAKILNVDIDASLVEEGMAFFLFYCIESKKELFQMPKWQYDKWKSFAGKVFLYHELFDSEDEANYYIQKNMIL